MIQIRERCSQRPPRGRKWVHRGKGRTLCEMGSSSVPITGNSACWWQGSQGELSG